MARKELFAHDDEAVHEMRNSQSGQHLKCVARSRFCFCFACLSPCDARRWLAEANNDSLLRAVHATATDLRWAPFCIFCFVDALSNPHVAVRNRMRRRVRACGPRWPLCAGGRWWSAKPSRRGWRTRCANSRRTRRWPKNVLRRCARLAARAVTRRTPVAASRARHRSKRCERDACVLLSTRSSTTL